MTINGSVTLRGPVANSGEKQRVGALAKEAAGVTEVINNVDVPPAKPPKKKH
jgi:osmotically-inducible protein OsmY